MPPPVAPEEYLALLRSPAGEAEMRRLLPLVTVGKTDFFRDEGQFAALRQLLPGLLAALPRNFAYGLKALIDQGGAPGAPVAEEAPAEAPAADAAPAAEAAPAADEAK